MEQNNPAKSVFEFLTARNPDVAYPKPSSLTLSGPNSSAKSRLRPKQLKIWYEFSFQTMEAIYKGSLMQVARQNSSCLCYPYLKSDVDCVVNDESTTLHLLTKWNHTIVTASLDLVENFQPCYWVPKATKTKAEEVVSTDTDQQMKQRSSRLRVRTVGHETAKTKRSAFLIPDAGGSLLSRANDSPNRLPAVERLPKEYKTASKWRSSDLDNALDKNGYWKVGTRRSMEIKPIEQVYTYCVNLGCRYGCILTTREAFIFRIKPCATVSDPASVSSMDDMKKLGEKLAKDGLLEYISVPWKNHRSGDPEKYKDLTVNLALWFIHILAGNDYEISWDYGALISETLGTKTITSSTAPKASQLMSNPEILAVSQEAAISSGTRLPSGKHRREEPCEDPIHFSFSESQQLRTQLAGSPTEQSMQSDSDAMSESEGESRTHDGSRSTKRHKRSLAG